MTCAILLGRPEPEAHLAVDYFVYRVAKEIGALTAVLGGLDGLVFTAGIGENSPEIRQRICKASAWLGIELDEAANTTSSFRHFKAQEQSLGLGDPHKRGTNDCAPYRFAPRDWQRPQHKRSKVKEN